MLILITENHFLAMLKNISYKASKSDPYRINTANPNGLQQSDKLDK